MHKLSAALIPLLIALVSCVRSQPEIIVITATFVPPTPITSNVQAETALPSLRLSPVPQTPLSIPTYDPIRVTNNDTSTEHVVQPGDTLSGIAVAYNVSLDALLVANKLLDPNVLNVGQVINLPGQPNLLTGDFKIIPDSRLVRGPGSRDFDIAAFINLQPGYIRLATDMVTTNLATGSTREEELSAADVVARVSFEFSVDPRLLLTLLEYKSRWLSDPEPSEELKTHPLISEESSGGVDRGGLYHQMSWAANVLNSGYYGWKTGVLAVVDFADGLRARYTPGLNAGTVGLQLFLSQDSPYERWNQQVSSEGFYQTYYAYFGDPFENAIDPLIPRSIQQPPLTFPFPPGETWYFTGGPHGGWGGGSAWAALDFAPPDERTNEAAPCYLSDHWATAVAPGVIARSADGVVVLDLDGDGDESTGWTMLYLHVASEGRIGAGSRVETGDLIGRPSCEGGVSTATHLHIARRFNGEWIPADCQRCAPTDVRPRFEMSGWVTHGLSGQVYQGYMEKDQETRIAEQGRSSPENRVSADDNE